MVAFAVLAGLSSVLLWLDGANRRGLMPVNEYKPAWLLIGEAYLLGNDRASAATVEVVDRIDNQQLGPEWRDQLLNVALDRHRQTWRAFPDSLWATITRAMIRGMLTFEQISRVYEDTGGEVVDIEVNRNTAKRAYPGESIRLRGRFRWRDGAPSRNNIRDAFVIDNEYETLVEIHTPSGVVQAATSGNGRVFVGDGFGKQSNRFSCEFTIPEELPPDVYRAEIRVSMKFDPSMLSHLSAVGLSDKEYAEYETLGKEIVADFEIEVAELGSDDPVVVEPESLSGDPTSLIEFELIDHECALHGHQLPVAYFRIARSPLLKSEIGLAGYIVMQQETRMHRTQIRLDSGSGPEEDGAVMLSILPGRYSVRYQYNQLHARRARDGMEQVLGGSVDLGEYELPMIVNDPQR
ncbi:MAG: hypothetical protein Phyf2KO_09630 [Phycisphaerales bacterium]